MGFLPEMQKLTIQRNRPANDPADFVADKVELPGAREVYFDAENDQMQVGVGTSDREALAKSVRTSQAIERDSLIRNKDQISGLRLPTSVISFSPFWKISSRSRKPKIVKRRSTFANVLGRRFWS